MEKYLKKISIREDGFIEIQLKKMKDFDSYIFQQIQKDSTCLPCIRDPHSKGKLYYDVKGYLSIAEYLSSHNFAKGEFTNFLIYVLRELSQANIAKPVFLSCDYIFINYDAKMIHFIIIPLAMDRWVFEKDTTQQFLKELISLIKSDEDYEAVGCVVQTLKCEEVKIATLLQALENLQLMNRQKPTFMEKLLHIDKEDPYQVLDLPLPKKYAPSMQSFSTQMRQSIVSENEDEYDVTVDLFVTESDNYLLNEKSKEKIVISDDICTIGRKDDNIIVVKSKGVSSYHASINKGKIEDLHSLNGTFVNNKKINCYVLKDGDRLSLGDANFTYHEQSKRA